MKFLSIAVASALVAGWLYWRPVDLRPVPLEVTNALGAEAPVKQKASEVAFIAPPSPMSAVDSRTPGKRLLNHGSQTFAGAADLWKFANLAAASDDKALQLEGLVASRECMGLVGIQDDLRLRIQSTPAGRAERDEALSAVLNRCKGFIQADSDTKKKLLKKLEDLSSSSLALKLSSSTKISADDIFAALDVGSSVATHHALIALSSFVTARAESQLGSADTEKRNDLFMVAALGSGCDLGRDCSPAAFEVLLQCAMMGACDGWIFNSRGDSISAADWEFILRQRRGIVAAIAVRDIGPLITSLSAQPK